MRAIFISYRRDDSEGHAGRLFEALVGAFGADAVFMDVTGIEPGRDFRKVIDEYTASCRVLLALIGKDWIDARDAAGARRLDDPLDFVRLETAAALKRDIAVIPVLVQGARMPKADQLPDDLKELVFRNNVELTHARWDSDVQVLIRALRPLLQTATDGVADAPAPAPRAAQPPPPSPAAAPAVATPATPPRKPGLTAAIALALALAGIGGGGYVAYQARQATKAEAERAAALAAAHAEQSRLAEEARKAEAARAAQAAQATRKAAEADKAAREARAAEPVRRAAVAPPTQIRDEAPAPPDLSGRWRDNWGTVSQIVQAGRAFRFAAEGTSCKGGYFQSQGSGTVHGNSVQSSYQSNIPSRGNCSGSLSADGTRVTSTCTDTACGTFTSSSARQR